MVWKKAKNFFNSFQLLQQSIGKGGGFRTGGGSRTLRELGTLALKRLDIWRRIVVERKGIYLALYWYPFAFSV